MNRSIAAVLVAAAALLGWIAYELIAGQHAEHQTPLPVAQKSLVAEATFRVTDTGLRKAPLASTPTAGADPAQTFALFKQRKTCFDNAQPLDELLGQIADLQTDSVKADAQSRAEIETEIGRKKAQLAALQVCGKQPATRAELSRLLEAAAAQGDPSAQLAFALDPMIDQAHSIANLDVLSRWRDAALGYIRAAAERGEPDALVGLAGAYDPLQCQASNNPCLGSMIGHLVEPDAATAYRYYEEINLQGNAPGWVSAELSSLRPYLTSDQVEAAERAAHAAIARKPQ